MKGIQIVSSAFLITLLTACTVSIQQLAYFQVEPYAKPFTAKLDIPLNIVFMKDVEDNPVVKGEGVKEMYVTNFRQSLGASLKNTFEKNFEEIAVLDSLPEEGLTYVIYRIRPFWKMNSQSTYAYGSEGRTATRSFISAAFQFESSLILNGERIESADFTVYSDDQMSSVRQAHVVFKSGLLKTCETMNREIFNDEIVDQLITLTQSDSPSSE